MMSPWTEPCCPEAAKLFVRVGRMKVPQRDSTGLLRGLQILDPMSSWRDRSSSQGDSLMDGVYHRPAPIQGVDGRFFSAKGSCPSGMQVLRFYFHLNAGFPSRHGRRGPVFRDFLWKRGNPQSREPC